MVTSNQAAWKGVTCSNPQTYHPNLVSESELWFLQRGEMSVLLLPSPSAHHSVLPPVPTPVPKGSALPRPPRISRGKGRLCHEDYAILLSRALLKQDISRCRSSLTAIQSSKRKTIKTAAWDSLDTTVCSRADAFSQARGENYLKLSPSSQRSHLCRLPVTLW